MSAFLPPAVGSASIVDRVLIYQSTTGETATISLDVPHAFNVLGFLLSHHITIRFQDSFNGVSCSLRCKSSYYEFVYYINKRSYTKYVGSCSKIEKFTYPRLRMLACDLVFRRSNVVH